MLKSFESRKGARGFSLIEIMFVMAIVAGILVGIGVLISSGKKSINADDAIAKIQNLKAMVDMHRTRHGGQLPETLEEVMPPGTTEKEKNNALNDPWNHRFQYQTPSQHNDPDDYDIWSTGPDGNTIIGTWK